MQEKYMELAIEEADKALEIDEMPVGAIVVYNDKVIGTGYNKKESEKNSLMHAEIIAIDEACKNIGDWRLNDSDIYVTLEPCLMCMGAIIESRIKNVYCGVTNNRFHELNLKICEDSKINIKYDIMSYKIEKQLDKFFKNIRDKNN